MTEVRKKQLLMWGSLALGALGSGLLFVLQYIIIFFKLRQIGETFTFFSFNSPDPLVNLAPMMRDVLDGHLWMSDGRVWENSYLPNLWSSLDPLLIAPFTLLTHSASGAILLGHFFMAAATCIVVFFLARKLVGSRIWAFCFSLLFSATPILGYYLFPTSLDNMKVVIRTLLPLGSPPGEVLMSKYVSFSVLPGLPIFAAAFLSLLVALERKEKKWQVLAGLINGLLIYVYLTDVLYLFTAMGIMAVIFILLKRYAEVKKLLCIVGLAVAVSAGYWWNFLYIQSLPWSHEFYIRLGGDLTHQFRISQYKEYLAYILFSLLIWRFGNMRQRPVAAIFLVGLALAGIVVLNIQVVTGYNPAPSAWSVHQMYFGLFLGWLFLVHAGFQVVAERWPSIARWLGGFLVLLVVAALSRAVYTQYFMASYLYRFHTMPPAVVRSLEWLDTHTPTDAVVASPSLVTNALLPVFTHNNSLLVVAGTSAASQQEINDRFFVAYALFDVPPAYFQKALANAVAPLDAYISTAENNLTTWLFEGYYVDHSIDGYINNRTADIPPEVADQLVAEFVAYPRRPGYLLHRYRVDYLYIGPYERAMTDVDFDARPYLEKVYDEGGIAIYRIGLIE